MKEKKKSIQLSEEKTYEDLTTSDQDFLKKAIGHGMTRREAIRWMAAAGLTATTAGTLFTSAQEVLAQTPKKGGSVRFAADLHGPDNTLDPILFTSTIDYTRGRAMYNSLTQFRDGIEPVGDLAEEFSANATATEWTFKLYKNVKFHDGTPCTADDVIYSMNRHKGEASKSVVKTLVENVKEWKKVDSHTVTAVLDGPDVGFLSIMGMFQFKIVKKDENNFLQPVGTGPYKMVEFQAGVRSVSVRNDDYFREGGNFDQIEIFGITDSVARVNALLSGDIQLMQALDPKAIRQVESNPNTVVSSFSGGAYFGICCLLNTAPGNNPDFVQMMKLLPKRERILKSILKGQGSLGNDQPINIAYGADHCTSIPQTEHDADKAKFHMKKSGITSAELYVSEVAPGITDACLMIQREAAKIGFELQIKKVPNDGYWGAVWLKEPLNVVSWNMRPTAHAMLNIAFAPDAPWNDTYWKNERFGKLLNEARGVTDRKKRYEMYCEMENLVRDGSGMVIPIHRNYVDATRTNIKGIPNVPLGVLGGCEWPEFAWLA